MTKLKNHSDFWLSPAAAASLERFEAKFGVIPINSAGRTEAEQNELIRRYFVVGGYKNRPPYLFAPARPANASRHVFGGGLAIDTSDKGIALMHAHGEEYGWYFNFSYDAVHFEYEEAKDLHRDNGASGSTTASQVVKNEQDWLNKSRGEKLKTDGIVGPATIDAFKRYQTFLKGYGYTGAVDGKWGPATQAAHAKFYGIYTAPKPGKSQGGRPTIRKGVKGELVRDLQGTLNRNYPAYSKLTIDGNFGPGTEKVVKEFQKRSGLTPDGVVGPQTWAKLGL
jgi:hypothetical protein